MTAIVHPAFTVEHLPELFVQRGDRFEVVREARWSYRFHTRDGQVAARFSCRSAPTTHNRVKFGCGGAALLAADSGDTAEIRAYARRVLEDLPAFLPSF